MTPERWKQVKEAFQAVLDLPTAERGTQLAALDDELRREVESLIAAANTEAGEFLEQPDDHVGRRVGPWRIVEEIGRGGMGAVYRATRDDDELETEVALKVVKRGMDTDFVLRRFRAERQILAGLSHPNIARLLDAGSTEDGTPWFAMELVRGEPIDRYAERHALDVDARLALFVAVCSAVQHAHQNLVVHRDIKPSNILVTDEGRPVLLDFGIAKLLDPEAHVTATEMAIMTPAYASPEQLGGKPITTASDVYSLGVLLYELLSGQRPYDVPTERSLAEAGPASAATRDPRRARQLRGDLDAIVAMAMRASPAERYATPRDLANDLGAYLDGRPTTARREGMAGRAWKLVRRHRVAAVGAVTVLVTLLGGVIATTRQAQIAKAERARAERRFVEVRQLSSQVLFELHDAIAELPGATPARAKLVETSRLYLEGLAADSDGRPDLLIELSGAWLRLGDVQGNASNANLGDTGGARTSYARALATAEEAQALAPDAPSVRRAVGVALNRAGDMAWEDGDLDAAAAALERSIEVLEAVKPDDDEGRHLLAQSLIDLADTVHPKTPERSMALYEQAQKIEEALVSRLGDTRPLRTLSVLYNKLARIAAKRDDRTAALDGYRKALVIREELHQRAPTSAAARRDLSASLGNVAGLLVASGELWEARTLLERALEIDQAISGADPDDVRALRDVAVTNIKLAELDHEIAKGATGADQVANLRAARAGFRRALEAWTRLEASSGLTPGDDHIGAEIVAAVTECDQELAALGYAGD